MADYVTEKYSRRACGACLETHPKPNKKSYRHISKARYLI